MTARLERVAAPGTGELPALYVAKLRIQEPGTYWLVAQPKGSTVQALGQFEVKAKSGSPALGSPAPRTDTPTLGELPISQLTTRTPPDRDLLRWSVADSIAAHKPFVVTFATPKYCDSRTCGPVVDVVRGVAHDFPGLRFIHVEIYEHNDPHQGQNQWVRAWKLPSEPWTFVVGADGRIKAKFEGAFSARELPAGSEGEYREIGRTAYSLRGETVRGLPGMAAVESGGKTLYSVKEVAGQLGVHPETIRRLIHDGRLDAVRIGRVLRVDGDAVDAFLARQRVKPERS